MYMCICICYICGWWMVVVPSGCSFHVYFICFNAHICVGSIHLDTYSIPTDHFVTHKIRVQLRA